MDAALFSDSVGLCTYSKSNGICAPIEDVVDNCAAVGDDAPMLWMPFAEQRQPFSFQLKHHSRVGCRSIHRSKRHHGETLLVSLWGEECCLLLIRVPDRDLMEALAAVKGDKPKEESLHLAEIFDGTGAAWNRECKWLGTSISTPEGDTHTPYKVLDIVNILLVWLGRKDDH
jgi:hypothetical protein